MAANRNRDKARDGLSSLRANGVVSATFHENGKVASVVFGPLAPEGPAAKLLPFERTKEPDPKSDLDVLDSLPAMGDE